MAHFVDGVISTYGRWVLTWLFGLFCCLFGIMLAGDAILSMVGLIVAMTRYSIFVGFCILLLCCCQISLNDIVAQLRSSFVASECQVPNH